MKVVIIGGTGTIGKAIAEELSKRHEIITVGHSSGDAQVDITDPGSIDSLYEQITDIDAIVLSTGKIHFGELTHMKDTQYRVGIDSKLMGQVNVVLAGIKHLNDNGSFTLTSGILNRDPIRFGSSAAMINAAVEGFVTGAAIEMPRGLRINCVSPTVIEESMKDYGAYFHGYEPVAAAKAAMASSKSVEGLQTGQVYPVGF